MTLLKTRQPARRRQLTPDQREAHAEVAELWAAVAKVRRRRGDHAAEATATAQAHHATAWS